MAGDTSPVLSPGQVQLGPARFTVVTPECIRLEYQASGQFVDAPSLFAAERERRYGDAKISAAANRVEIDTGRIHLTYRPDGLTFGSGNLEAQILVAPSSVTWTPGMANTENLGGTLHSLDYVAQPMGFGEGVLSRRGWYVLDDSARPILTDGATAAADGWIADRPAGSGIDWYLFGYGHDYAAGLRALTAIGGAVPLPRKYVLGAWYSRWWKYTSDDYRQLVKEFHEHDFPLDVLVFDMYWHIDGWTGFSWNRKLLPDAENLLRWLHEQGIHVPLNDHPGASVRPAETMYGDFMHALGEDPSTGAVVPFDAGNRRYMDTLFRYAHSARERDGADFWWLDWMGDQSEHFNILPWLNEYYYRHSEESGQRGQSFARWAGWGDHRHPIHFSGDTYADWWMLEYQVPFTATAGNVGAFYWSHDVGGFMPSGPLGSFAGREPPELLARWAQFGALSPVLRLHSTQDFRFDKRPWKWGRDVEDSVRSSFHLRAQLVPYLYSAAWEGHHDSLPLLRPLYLESAEDAEAYRNPQEYELGDALLAAPVTRAGKGAGHVASQAVWFPPSAQRWFQWSTGEEYAGGTTRLITADLTEAPFFARGGVPIPLQPYTERPGMAPLSTLVVRAFPGPDRQVGSAVLYEDDGLSRAYREDGAYALTPISYQRAGEQISIQVEAAVGAYAGQLEERAITVELPGTARAQAAWVNGVSVPFEYDDANRVNRVAVSARSVRQPTLITVQAAEVAAGTAAELARARRLQGAAGDALMRLAIVSGQGVVPRGGGAEVFPGSAGAQVTIEDRAGESRRSVLSSQCDAPEGISCSYNPGPPRDDGSLPPGAEIVREITVKLGNLKATQELGRVMPKLRAWSWVGPFAYDPARPLAQQIGAPEKTSELNLHETYPAIAGPALRWAAAPVSADGAVDLAALASAAGSTDRKIAYAVTFLHTEQDQGIRLSVQSDDGAEVFLDGIKILSHDTPRSLDSPAGDVLTLLKAGNHTLLIKVANVTGAWGFRVGAVTDSPIELSAKPF